MKIRGGFFALAVALPVALCGCVVTETDADEPIVRVPSSPPPVTVEKEAPDVNIQLKQDPIEIKQDPPTKATTGF